MGDQLHAPAALPYANYRWYALDKLCGPLGRSGHGSRKKISFHCLKHRDRPPKGSLR